MNDYSEYLKKPGILAWIEKEWKLRPEIHNSHAEIVNTWLKKVGAKSCAEIGCGTGEVARRITEDVTYMGIDSNQDCISKAEEKNRGKYFTVEDVRKSKLKGMDVVFCFGFLKHFSFVEWPDVFQKVAAMGKYLIFDIPIATQTMDDGVEYHHVWMSMERLREEIEAAGLKLVDTVNAEGVEPVFVCKCKEVVREKKKREAEWVKVSDVNTIAKPKVITDPPPATNYSINTKNDPNSLR